MMLALRYFSSLVSRILMSIGLPGLFWTISLSSEWAPSLLTIMLSSSSAVMMVSSICKTLAVSHCPARIGDDHQSANSASVYVLSSALRRPHRGFTKVSVV